MGAGFFEETGITKVYVTGHSLGAAMVHAYMDLVENDRTINGIDFGIEGIEFEAVTFASPGYPHGEIDEYDSNTMNFTTEYDAINIPDAFSVSPGDDIIIRANVDGSIVDTPIGLFAAHDMSLYLGVAEAISGAGFILDDFRGDSKISEVIGDPTQAQVFLKNEDGTFSGNGEGDTIFAGSQEAVVGTNGGDIIELSGNISQMAVRLPA